LKQGISDQSYKNFSEVEIERDRLIKETGYSYIITQNESGAFECKRSAEVKKNAANIETITLHPTNKLVLDYLIQLSIPLFIFIQSEEITVKIIQVVNNRGLLEFITKINSSIEFVGALAFSMFFIRYLYRVLSRTYTIDNEGIKIAEGIIAKNIKVICYKDIQTPTLKRSLSDRILNTGTLEFSAAGTSSVDMYFEKIDSPQNVLDLILANASSK